MTLTYEKRREFEGWKKTHTGKFAIKHILNKQNDCCAICRNPIQKVGWSREVDYGTVDHIVPLREGGDPINPQNIRILHNSCHEEWNKLQQPKTRDLPKDGDGVGRMMKLGPEKINEHFPTPFDSFLRALQT